MDGPGPFRPAALPWTQPMKPTAILAALAALCAGSPAAANPLVTLVNETGETWVLLTDLGHRIPGVLTATRSARDGAEGSGQAKRTDPARHESLTLTLAERDAAVVRLEQPTHPRPRVMLHLLMPRPGFHQFHLEYRLDTRAVPARGTLVPLDDDFCPLDQDTYRLHVSADGGTVRIRRKGQGGGGEEVKAEAKVEAKAKEEKVPGLEDPAGACGSPACAIL